jgi:hypothetical protein
MMVSNLLAKTSASYSDKIAASGIRCGIGKDITSKDGTKLFLTAGTPITANISERIVKLKAQGIIDSAHVEDDIQIQDITHPAEFMQSIRDAIKTNPILTRHQLAQTLATISRYVETEQIPQKILEHLTVFFKANQTEYQATLLNLVFGVHIGKANNYSASELNELISVLFFADIGFARLNPEMKNAVRVHPILSMEIVQQAGIDNRLILESILQHEEKLDGTGYPNKATRMHEYAQISQIVNQYSQLYIHNRQDNCQLGHLFLLGQQFDFRTGEQHKTVYEPSLQKPLISIMQEKFQSQEHLLDYGAHLHAELSKVIKWTHTHASQDPEIFAIQTKMKRALWVSHDTSIPFKVKLSELGDSKLCKEFVTDAMRFIHQIVESTNYLNRVLNYPMEINGQPISGEYFLKMAHSPAY